MTSAKKYTKPEKKDVCAGTNFVYVMKYYELQYSINTVPALRR